MTRARKFRIITLRVGALSIPLWAAAFLQSGFSSFNVPQVVRGIERELMRA